LLATFGATPLKVNTGPGVGISGEEKIPEFLATFGASPPNVNGEAGIGISSEENRPESLFGAVPKVTNGPGVGISSEENVGAGPKLNTEDMAGDGLNCLGVSHAKNGFT
jgi:hypothetical protein